MLEVSRRYKQPPSINDPLGEKVIRLRGPYAKKRLTEEPAAVAGCRWIPLTKGAFALVDEGDFAALSKLNWRLSTWGYAVHQYRRASDGRQTSVFMHRVLRPATSPLEVDHINRNRLDNRSANLRVVTRAENQANRGDRVTRG